MATGCIVLAGTESLSHGRASQEGELDDDRRHRAAQERKVPQRRNLHHSHGEVDQRFQGLYREIESEGTSPFLQKFVDELLHRYEGCVVNLQSVHRTRREATLELIRPVNFTKEVDSFCPGSLKVTCVDRQ